MKTNIVPSFELSEKLGEIVNSEFGWYSVYTSSTQDIPTIVCLHYEEVHNWKCDCGRSWEQKPQRICSAPTLGELLQETPEVRGYNLTYDRYGNWHRWYFISNGGESHNIYSADGTSAVDALAQLNILLRQ